MLEKIWIEILNMSLTASVAILAICLIRLFLKRTPRIFSYVLWAVVLFRLLCPFSIESTFSFLNALDGGAAAEQGRMEYISSDIGYQAQPQVQLAAGAFSDTVNEIVSDSLPAANVGDSVNPVQVILFATARIWLAGLLVMVIYQLVSLLRFHKRLRGAECEEGNIYRLPGEGTPFVYGLVRPRIYLPSGLSDKELRYMLLHEQIHIRRGDQIFRFLGCAALCLHWFNPLVWLAFYFSGKDMELSCDEAVLRQLGDGVKKEYSGSLLALAAGSTDDRKFRGSPVAFGENNIKSRIQNVLRYRKAKPAAAAFAVVICAAAVAALALNPNSIDRNVQTSAGDAQEAEGMENEENAEGAEEEMALEGEITAEDIEQEMTAESETDSDGILGYILYITDNTVAVDTAEWLTLTDTERMAELGITEDDMPGGFLIYNPDSDAENLTFAEDLTALLLDWENSYYPMESEISLEEFLTILQERAQTMDGTGEDGSGLTDYSQCGLFWFEMTDGAVTYIEEQYLP